LGDKYNAAIQEEAPHIIETSSFIAGKGFAGSTFSGSVSRGSRIDGDDWFSATLALDESGAQRYMHEQFGLTGADLNKATTQSAPMTSISDRLMSETGKLKEGDDAEVQALIDRRNAFEEMYKNKQRGGVGGGGGGGPAPAGMGTGPSGSSTAFSLMQPPQSREERTAGIEGMQLLRPLTNPPVRREEGAGGMASGFEGIGRGTF
jgi:hypothetical protein